ncbi:hypothetical protein SDC9_40499 [bioreactor metagenome]|uniref:Uncharacterized protein n=1 Tax=bioreactor metagenome TaxID=1076179 RepID=A0A644VSN6_9ZZZZ
MPLLLPEQGRRQEELAARLAVEPVRSPGESRPPVFPFSEEAELYRSGGGEVSQADLGLLVIVPLPVNGRKGPRRGPHEGNVAVGGRFEGHLRPGPEEGSPEAAGGDAHRKAPGEGVLGAETPPRRKGELRHRFGKGFPVPDGDGEGPGGLDGFLGLFPLLYGKTPYSPKFPGRPEPPDPEVLLQTAVGSVPQAEGRGDAPPAEKIAPAPADPPHVLHGNLPEKVVPRLAGQENESAPRFGALLRPFGRQLRRRLRRSRSHGDGNARLSQDRRPDVQGPFPGLLFPFGGNLQEGLVHGVDLHGRCKPPEGRHDPGRHFLVEPEIAGEHGGAVTFKKGPHPEEGLPHFHPEGLDLVGAGYDHPVVAGEHHHGTPLQIRAEEPFAGDEKIVAVAEGQQIGAGLQDGSRMTHVTTPQTLDESNLESRVASRSPLSVERTAFRPSVGGTARSTTRMEPGASADRRRKVEEGRGRSMSRRRPAALP